MTNAIIRRGAVAAIELQRATGGALSDPAFREEIIAAGKADVVELARALICDPTFPIKRRTAARMRSLRTPSRSATAAVTAQGPDGRRCLRPTPSRLPSASSRSARKRTRWFCAPEFYQVGNCLTPKNMYDANRLAFNAAMGIGKYR
jgi:hypothetical protein